MSRLKQLRTSRVYNGAIMFIGSIISAIASLALSIDSLILAKTPDTQLGCDINGKLSCSSVAKSWQANLIPMFGINVPNAFFGLAAFGIFIGFTAALMFGYRPVKPVRILLIIGTVFCVLFAGWLLLASVISIKVLCPWCLTMDVGVVLIVTGLIRWLVSLKYDGGPESDGLHHDDITVNILSGSIVSLLIEIVPLLIIGLLATMTFFS